MATLTRRLLVMKSSLGGETKPGSKKGPGCPRRCQERAVRALVPPACHSTV